MTREELATKTKAELREIADRLNIKLHHRAGEETIIAKIMQQPKAYIDNATNTKIDHSTEAHFHTPDEVREALKFFLQKEGFELTFPDDGVSWVMTCKGAIDSGSLSVPLRTIVMKAQTVSVGKRSPRGHTGYDAVTNKPNSQYTNVVLSL